MPKKGARPPPSSLAKAVSPRAGPGSDAPAATRRPTKAELRAEKFPHAERYPALQRALALLHYLEMGKSRAEAEDMADRKVGPRAPYWAAKNPTKPKRGRRPEPETRVRVQPKVRRR
ncbi:MAG: hypothetical protein LC620_09065 [Halobacteriales archaeon]|nr:hypothetical protein [Halobacteriales archaeon]